MNWEAIGALAAGATLIYLATQVRQVKKDLHVSGFREINRMFRLRYHLKLPELFPSKIGVTH